MAGLLRCAEPCVYDGDYSRVAIAQPFRDQFLDRGRLSRRRQERPPPDLFFHRAKHVAWPQRHASTCVGAIAWPAIRPAFLPSRRRGPARDNLRRGSLVVIVQWI